MRETDENIKKILDKINAGTDSEKDSLEGELEIEFDEKVGLVFSEEEPPVVTEKRAEPEAPINTPVTPLEIVEEFSLPESLEISPRYDTPTTPDVTARIFTTYVPRFTEVSDTYRMSDDPRPRKLSVGEKLPPRIEKIEEVSAESDPLDPTAELDSDSEGVVLVRADLPTVDDGTESLSLFKFSDEESSEPSEPTDEEREREELIRLIPAAATAALEEMDIADDSAACESGDREPHEFVMPDPESVPAIIYEPVAAVDPKPLYSDPDGVEAVEPQKKVRGEFTHQTQRELFKDAFLDSLMSVRVRMIASLIIAAIALVFENLSIFGVNVASLLRVEMIPGSLAIIDALFAAALMLLAIPETARAVKALAAGRALPELLLPAGLLVIIGYALTVALAPTVSYPLFGFVYATLTVSAIAGSYFRTSADFTAFKLASKNAEKRILDNKLTRTLQEENIALDGAIDEYKSRTARMFRAAFITDFYKRISKSSERSVTTAAALGIALGSAIVAGAVCFFLPWGGIVPAASAFALVFLLASPAALLLTHKLPYFDSQERALLEDSTVVGEPAYLDYSAVDVIAFEDTEIFGTDDVNLKRFMLYGDRDSMEKVMRQMSSLFATVGGPLEYIFQNALDKRSHPASNPVVELDGLSGEVDGTRIFAGTEEYMLRHDVKIPGGASRPEPAGTGTTRVMYAAEGGEVYAKFYIRYSFSEEFTMLLPELKTKGIVPLIYTRDPNVSNELLRTLTAGQDSIRVMKRLVPGTSDSPIYRRVSAGLVTYGNKINAINMILLAKKYKRMHDTLLRLEYYAVGAGAIVGAVLSVALSSPIPSALVALWQIGLTLSLRIVSKKIFRKDK